MKRTGGLITEGTVLFNVQGRIKRIIYTVYDGLNTDLIADTVRQSVKSGPNTGDSGARNPGHRSFRSKLVTAVNAGLVLHVYCTVYAAKFSCDGFV